MTVYTWKLLLSAEAASSEGSQDENSESFAFALVNGALGVFEVQGRRIKDFRYFRILWSEIVLDWFWVLISDSSFLGFCFILCYIIRCHHLWFVGHLRGYNHCLLQINKNMSETLGVGNFRYLSFILLCVKRIVWQNINK